MTEQPTQTRIRPPGILVAVVLLSACAAMGPRFDLTGVELGLTPERAAAAGTPAQPLPVVWGGQIVAGANLEDRTLLEVLAYPLNRQQRPVPEATPLGRFLVEYPGYLETATYGPGRLVSVSGTFLETRPGRIGEVRYTYPVLAADDVHLWPRREARAEPRVHFGIGVLFRN